MASLPTPVGRVPLLLSSSPPLLTPHSSLLRSDSSGYVLEPDGLTAAKLGNIAKIKAERGARIGRFIVASTTAK